MKHIVNQPIEPFRASMLCGRRMYATKAHQGQLIGKGPRCYRCKRAAEALDIEPDLPELRSQLHGACPRCGAASGKPCQGGRQGGVKTHKARLARKA